MIHIELPGNKSLKLLNLVLDYNGTLAVDGRLIDGVADRLNRLAQVVAINVITADTFGKAADNLKKINCRLTILKPGGQQKQKLEFISTLGSESVVAIGNGLNDKLMLEQAALGIVVIQTEGAAIKTLQSADVVSTNILDALDLLLNPLRLKATLRL